MKLSLVGNILFVIHTHVLFECITVSLNKCFRVKWRDGQWFHDWIMTKWDTLFPHYLFAYFLCMTISKTKSDSNTLSHPLSLKSRNKWDNFPLKKKFKPYLCFNVTSKSVFIDTHYNFWEVGYSFCYKNVKELYNNITAMITRHNTNVSV